MRVSGGMSLSRLALGVVAFFWLHLQGVQNLLLRWLGHRPHQNCEQWPMALTKRGKQQGVSSNSRSRTAAAAAVDFDGGGRHGRIVCPYSIW
jgi:hypothetical protein